jgi:flagellar biogenesis protein FliO
MNAGLTAMEVLRMLGSLAVVIALLLAVLWSLKRMQNKMLTTSQPGPVSYTHLRAHETG